MIKSDKLVKLEEIGIVFQDILTGKWYNGLKEDVDLTPYLLKAGMFEQ